MHIEYAIICALKQDTYERVKTMATPQLTDDQIVVGMQVIIQESQKSAPFNGAVGTVVEIGEYDEAPIYTVDLYGGRYRFRAYDLHEVH